MPDNALDDELRDDGAASDADGIASPDTATDADWFDDADQPYDVEVDDEATPRETRSDAAHIGTSIDAPGDWVQPPGDAPGDHKSTPHGASSTGDQSAQAEPPSDRSSAAPDSVREVEPPLLPDSEPNRIATEVVPQLRRYARGLARRSTALGAALDDYAGRVAAAARGELPAGAAQPPDSLSPDLVARELTPSRLPDSLELFRNVLIFMPVLWTWFEIGRATEAYSALVARGDGSAPERGSFLHLWQQAFDGAGGAWTLTLSQTAWIAAGLILLLVVVHLATTIARSANVRLRERRAADFAALLSRASALRRPETPETPQQQLEEFARAGLSLSTQLADLSVSFGQRTAPLAESLAAAERAMAGMSDLVRNQSDQMAEVTKSLSEVAAISRRLEAVEASITRSSEALEAIQNRLTPATDDLVDAIRGFSKTAEIVSRATDNFAEHLAGSGDDANALRDAAASLNAVGDRFLDTLGRP